MFLNLVSRPLIYISYIVFKNCNGLYSTFENVCYVVYLLKCVSLICLSPLCVFYSSLNYDGPRTRHDVLTVLYYTAQLQVWRVHCQISAPIELVNQSRSRISYYYYYYYSYYSLTFSGSCICCPRPSKYQITEFRVTSAFCLLASPA